MRSKIAHIRNLKLKGMRTLPRPEKLRRYSCKGEDLLRQKSG